MPIKGKYITKKRENPSSLDLVRTTIVQIHIPKQSMLRNKTISFLCLTWSARTIICMQILTRDSEDTFFSWPIQRRHEAEEEIFFTKSLLTWLGPSKQPTDAGDSDPREHQPTNSQSWAKRPRFSQMFFEDKFSNFKSLKKMFEIFFVGSLRFFLKKSLRIFFKENVSNFLWRKGLRISLKKETQI